MSKPLLIGGDDVSDDVIALVPYFTLVSRRGATGEFGDGIQNQIQGLIPFPAPPTERSSYNRVGPQYVRIF